MAKVKKVIVGGLLFAGSCAAAAGITTLVGSYVLQRYESTREAAVRTVMPGEELRLEAIRRERIRPEEQYAHIAPRPQDYSE